MMFIKMIVDAAHISKEKDNIIFANTVGGPQPGRSEAQPREIRVIASLRADY